MRRPLDPEVRQGTRIVVGERLGEQSRDEAFVVPDLEKVLLSQHVDFASHQGALAEPGLDQDAALGIEEDQVYEAEGMLGMDDLWDIAAVGGFDELRYPSFSGVTQPP